MKKIVKNIILLITFISLFIAGIYFLVNTSISNNQLSDIEKMAYTVPNTGYHVLTKEWSITKLNRFFIPYYSDSSYAIYCMDREVEFPCDYGTYLGTDGNKYDGSLISLSKKVTFKPSSSSILSPSQAYIFSKNKSTSTYGYTTNYTSSEYNVVSKKVREWYVKQNAYWKLIGQKYGTYVGYPVKVTDNGKTTTWNTGTTIKSEIDQLYNESLDYYAYHNKVTADNGLDPYWIKASKDATKEYKNGKTILGPYKMSYYSASFDGYSFSGISDMKVVKKGGNNNSGNSKIESIKIIRNGKEQSKAPVFFTPNSEYISRQTNLWFPSSYEEFYVVIDGTNYDDVDLQLDVTFSYMTAEGYRVNFKGYVDGTKEVQPVNSADAKRTIKTQSIKNKDVISNEGNYKLYVCKEDEKGNKLSNAKFKIEGTVNKDVITNGNGKANITNYKITDSNYEDVDTYTITEISSPTGYIKLNEKIKVEVHKIQLSTGDYQATYSLVVLDKNNNADASKQNIAYSSIENDVITITIKNHAIKSGEYSLDIKKVSSEDANKVLQGAEFNIEKWDSAKKQWVKHGTTAVTGSNGKTTITKQSITTSNYRSSDYYRITEISAPAGYTLFDGQISIKVVKKIDESAGKYVIDMDKTIVTAKDKNGKEITENSPVSVDKKDGTVSITMKNEPSYDLALRKFITSINGKAPTVTRVPSIAASEITALKNGTKTTAVKSHPKNALEVTTGDKVVYTIRVYNEGNVNGKATQITDYLPEGLKLAENSKINTTYGWTNPSKDGKTMVSEYLKDKEIAAFNGTTLAYRDVQIECEVTATKAQNLKNIAEITDDDGADRDSTPKNVNRGNYGSTSQQDDDDFEVLKFRPTLNLGGTVWLDLRGGKETLANGLKDSDNKDEKGLKGVKVELYQKDDTSPYTDGERIAETTTKDDGTYTFKGLPMDKLYYVKFTYNGQNYENTIYNAQKANNDTRKNSHATEKKQDRDNFNNGFNINDISDTELKNELGYFEDYNKLTYKNRKNQNISCAISAYTGQQSGKSFAYSLYGRGGVDNVTINTIDFGITKRIEFDMQLKQDVYAATVRVNGKHGIYGYDTIDLSKEDWTLLVDDADLKYERKIADADYNFTGVNEEGDGKLEIYVTYKIAIHNSSMSMLGEVTKIKDYYDKYYTYVPGLSWISSKNYSTNDLNSIEEKILNVVEGNSKEISLTGEEKMVPPVNPINGKDYNILEISLGDNAKKITTGENQYLYLTFKVNEENKYVKLGPKTNKAEIVEYKSYYKKGTKLPYYNYNNDKLTTYEVQNDTTLAGRVDRNSIPNNMNISDGPKENDENEAPVLDVICEGNRRISGSVWEDARNNKVDDSVIGDGTFNDKDDKKIDIVKEGITIELYRAESEGTFKKLEDKPSIEGNRYTFNNVVAGDYIVKFTYGDGTVKYNGQDYKSTIFDDYGKTEHDIHKNGNISRAGDVWDEREKLNNSSKTMKNAKAKSLAEKKDCLMAAETKKIVAEIEFGRQVTTENSKTKSNPGYLISGVNLGLVERPKAQLELNKTVSNVKVTLADGSILFDVNQSADNVAWKPNTAYNIDSNKKNGIYDKSYRPTIGSNAKGLVQLSMDEEIMHGATIQITYKIKVKNVGEVDYEGKEFYYTGKNHENTVTTTPNRIIDYVSNNLQFNSNSNTNDWQVMTVNDVINNKLVNADVAGVILKDDKPQYNTILTTTFSDTLKPGDSTAEKTLVLTQTITPENTSDNLKYINIAEIVETSNTAGRRMAYSIVGNQNPTEAVAEVDASSSEEVMILPPFGDTHIYYILGTVIGIILIGGIAFIIRKVLKK